MTTTADTSKLVSYTVLEDIGEDVSKIVSYVVLDSNFRLFGSISIQSSLNTSHIFSNSLFGSIGIESTSSPTLHVDSVLRGNVDVRLLPSPGLVFAIPLNGSLSVKSDTTTDTLTIAHPLFGNIEVKSQVSTSESRYTSGIGGSDVGIRALTDADPLWVAVEIDLLDRTIDATQTLRLSNRGTLTRVVDGTMYQYMPRLNVPFLVGTSISLNSYSDTFRGQPNSGSISWVIDPDFAYWLDQHVYGWVGQTFRVYEGRTASDLAVDVDVDLDIVYTGHVVSLTYDVSSNPSATIQTTDPSSSLDKSLISDFYASNFVITSLQGKPRPQIWGKVFSIEPVLEDEINLVYRVSRLTLDDILEVRVGGVPWRRVPAIVPLVTTYQIVQPSGPGYLMYYGGASDVSYWTGTGATVTLGTGLPALGAGEALYTIIQPVGPSYVGALTAPGTANYQYWVNAGATVYPYVTGSIVPSAFLGGGAIPATTLASPSQGEWYGDVIAGTIQLGSVTGGADIRCDAQAIGWETLDTAALITDICTQKSVNVNPSYMAQLHLDFAGIVGYYSGTDQKNTLDVLDDITKGGLCWWAFDASGLVIAGVIDGPEIPSSDFVLYNANPQVPFDISQIPSDTIDPIPKEIEVLSFVRPMSPVYRARVEYARNWVSLSQALIGITDEEAAVMKSGGIILDFNSSFFGYQLSPLQGRQILDKNPRAEDVLVNSLASQEIVANSIRTRLIQRISGTLTRSIINVNARMRSTAITLMKIASVIWIDDSGYRHSLYGGKLRIVSAIRSIGGGAQQLQLWGGFGTVSSQRYSQTDITLTPSMVIPVLITFASYDRHSSDILGSIVATITVVMSDLSPFFGTYDFAAPYSDDGGLVVLTSINSITAEMTLARDLTSGDIGTHNVTVSATQNATTITSSFSFEVRP